MFGAWGLVSRSTPSGTTWYAFDERGNVAQRTGSGGGVVSSDLYDAFGNVTRTGGPDVFGFGGQAGYYTDTETGLILCTNRHYDPQQGRFLTRDPLGYGGGINLYGYTANNPVNGMDASGLYEDDNHRGGFGHPEPGIPVIGPVGASIYRNVAEAQQASGIINGIWLNGLSANPPRNMAGVLGRVADQREMLYGWYIDKVATGHEWDYKYHTKSDIPPGKHRGEYLFDPYGNFNAGAVAAALGLSKAEALKGADDFHIVDHPLHPWTDPEDHGDEWIAKGYDWYTKTHGCKK